MARGRYATNPAKVKADLEALESDPPREIFDRRLRLRRRASILLLCLLTTVLLTASFAPFDCWVLGYVALVPWTLALASGEDRRWSLLWATMAGLLFWAGNLYWLWWVTLAGYAPLVAYLSLYWLAAALVIRRAIRRGLPMWLALPLVWVALEYARAHVISGFPWFDLAHSQYARTRLIQVADLTGTYGVSFFVGMVNGALVDVLNSPLFVRSRRGVRMSRQIFIGAGACLVTAAVLLVYGTWRLNQETTSPGPVIGICQQAFPISLNGEMASQAKMFDNHLQASRKFKGSGCELVLWPETMLPTGLNAEFMDLVLSSRTADLYGLAGYARQMEALSKELDCPILAGGATLHEDPLAPPPSLPRVRNSALWFDRSWRSSQEYSKRHLVPFSEYVPFRESWPWLHELLRGFVPAAMPQLDPGRSYTRFRLSRRDGGGEWVLAAPICYEGTFARICRDMVMRDGKKEVDILANLSNDGWFYWQWARHRSTENAQHLAHYCFRAVECRVPVVRAVNTGISASIDSNGRLIAAVEQYGVRRMVAGQLLLGGQPPEKDDHAVQLAPQVLVDSRVTVYSLVGDLFAQMVSATAGVMTIVLVFRKGRTNPGEVKGQ